MKNFHHKDKKHRKYYEFQCECGTIKILNSSLVKSGNTKSCGCLSKEVKRNRRLPNNYSEITAIYLEYKRHAKEKKLDFLLSREDFTNIIFKDCYYCGGLPSNLKTTKNSIDGLKYNGIDRINNKVGYIENNVVTCCKQCNLSKNNLTVEDFLFWVKKVYSKMESIGV